MSNTTTNYTRVRQSTLGSKAQSGAQRYDNRGIAIPQAIRTVHVAVRNPIRHLLTRGA